MRAVPTKTVLCDSCAKVVWKSGQAARCAVLKTMIGKKGDCFAYTDDPEWAQKVEAAIKDYALRARPAK